MNSRKCEACNVDVQRASHAKYLRSKKHLQIEKQNELLMPELFFQGTIEKKLKIYTLLNH